MSDYSALLDLAPWPAGSGAEFVNGWSDADLYAGAIEIRRRNAPGRAVCCIAW